MPLTERQQQDARRRHIEILKPNVRAMMRVLNQFDAYHMLVEDMKIAVSEVAVEQAGSKKRAPAFCGAHPNTVALYCSKGRRMGGKF